MKKYFFILLLQLTLLFHQILLCQVPEPYSSINELPFDNHGWFYNGDCIEKILEEKPCKIAIEIGSWLGLSTRFIASNMLEDGKLYAIDTWLEPNTPPTVYQLFLSNVKHAGLAHKIIPIRMSSQEASNALNVRADFIYIDAAYDEKGIYEMILAWHPHLKDDGVLCGAGWKETSAQKGITKAAIELNYEVNGDGDFWELQK